MAVQFAVLASGSRGNATLIRSGTSGLLLDLGIGPRDLTQRLESVGAGWDAIQAALLTHTHGDHVSDSGLRRLAQQGIPLYIHEGHRGNLRRFGGYLELECQGLIRTYDDSPFLAPGGMAIEPFELFHDGGPTFGFRVETRAVRRGRLVSIGYLADTGSWTNSMVDQVTDVDILGVEFNHDVELQQRSRRHPALIARNLGDRGHLSNLQGSEFVSAVLARSARCTVKHVVLLHLSEQCNRPDLALESAKQAVRGTGRRVVVHAAQQAPAHPNLWIEARRSPARPRPPGLDSRGIGTGQVVVKRRSPAGICNPWLFPD
ncbi:MAG: MBL fold metallo-hydrolase [Isosphaeraceae bacterium]